LAVVTAVFYGACSSSGDAQFGAEAITAAQDATTRVDGDALRAAVEGVVDVRATENPIVSAYAIQKPLVHVNSKNFVLAAFAALGYQPVQEDFGQADVAGTNVYVNIPGDLPELVIVSGHHDAWFQSGADDNGSAIAVLVETARALKDQHLHRSVRVIAFD